MKYNQDRDQTRSVTLRTRLKRDIIMQYHDDDQAGAQPHFGKIFLFVRSDIPYDINNAVLFQDYYPGIWACSKLLYHE